MADAAVTYSRLNRLLHFMDLLEDDRSKLSHTKVAAWGTALINFANMAYQFTRDHPDAIMLGATTFGHVIGAVKHEIKRRVP